jgi:hypothetical protein
MEPKISRREFFQLGKDQAIKALGIGFVLTLPEFILSGCSSNAGWEKSNQAEKEAYATSLLQYIARSSGAYYESNLTKIPTTPDDLVAQPEFFPIPQLTKIYPRGVLKSTGSFSSGDTNFFTSLQRIEMARSTETYVSTTKAYVLQETPDSS